jgi:hypothetical protein
MTNTNEYLLPDSLKPDWLIYPIGLVELVRSGRVKLAPWYLSKSAVDAMHTRDLKMRLGRDLVPFAYRQDREDLACFEKGKGEAVMIIHDHTDPGWEDEGSYPSFADWLAAAEEEAREWGESV